MLPKKSLILLIAHGSKLETANHEVQALAEGLKDHLGREVLAAFLEFGKPTISEGLDQALSQSPEEIVVLPYFLSPGNHVEEITQILSKKARAYPEISIKILDCIGTSRSMVDFLSAFISENSNP